MIGFRGILQAICITFIIGTSVARAGLLVADNGGSRILHYDVDTGDFLGVFAEGDELAAPQHMAFGPDGNLYVASSLNQTVVRLNGQTGQFIDVFATGGGSRFQNWIGVDFGPDGNLYVSTGGGDGILRFNGTTGAFIDVFASGGPLNTPTQLRFGPDGNLYVADFTSSSGILRYNGTTGALIDNFSVSSRGVRTFDFGVNGDLFAEGSGFFAPVGRFDLTSRAFLGFTASPSMGFKRGSWSEWRLIRYLEG